MISKKDFDKDEFHGREKHNAVLRFLFRNKDKAFKTSEISKKVGLKSNHVNVILSHAKKQKQVVHKPPYWSWNKKKVLK